MKRFLIVLLLAGCSPSVTELRAKRDELEKTAARLSYEANLMDRWLGHLEKSERDKIKAEVDGIRGDEYVNVCRDEKAAQLSEVMDKLAAIEKKLEKAVMD